MAINTKQKRMSAISPGCPWRWPMVDATEAGFGVGNRQAAAFLYSGIEAGEPEQGGGYDTPELCWVARRRYLHWSAVGSAAIEEDDDPTAGADLLFCGRYYAGRYFAPRYFSGATIGYSTPELYWAARRRYLHWSAPR